MIIKIPHDIDFCSLQVELTPFREVVKFDPESMTAPAVQKSAIDVIQRLLRSIDNLKKIIPNPTIYQFMEVYARTNSGVHAIIRYIQSMKYQDRKKCTTYALLSAEEILDRYITKKEE